MAIPDYDNVDWKDGGPWRAGNDSPVWLKPRRTVYFVYKRKVEGTWAADYYEDKRGRLIQFKTLYHAQAKANRMNKEATRG